MKSWLVFLGGAICGAVVASGLAWALFFNRFAPAANAAAARSAVITAQLETSGADTSANVDENKEPLETRLALLKAWTDGHGVEPDASDLYGTLGDWSELDPRAALAWVQGAKRLPQRLHVLAVPLAALARKNRAEAADWLRQNLSKADCATVLESAFQHLAGTSPRVALELVASFPGKRTTRESRRRIGRINRGISGRSAWAF
jgi:hypothetical protein